MTIKLPFPESVLENHIGMTAETPAVVHSFEVGTRTATLTIQRPRVGGIVNMLVEWEPDAPAKLSPVELGQYRQGRNSAVATLAAALNVKALVVEL